MRVAEEHLRELIESIPAAIYEAPVGTGEPWRYISPQIEALLGYRAEEWLNDADLWEKRLHPDEHDEILALERDQAELARRGRVTMVAQYRMVHRDGRVVWVRDEARLVEADGEQPYWRGVLIDVTAERDAALADGLQPDICRITCPRCGTVAAAERPEPCWKCGHEAVNTISLNATLAELAAVRERLDGVLEGVHRHLETLTGD